MEKLIIDRFEGIYAVCELADKSHVLIPKYKLPLQCEAGDSIIQDLDGMYQKDVEVKAMKEKKIRDRMNKLFE
ncbi:MAG: hypothetical protein H6Q59_3346 [Firmicutes bacterium]|nr:hypothetical protein [Bacillota bacterium]